MHNDESSTNFGCLSFGDEVDSVHGIQGGSGASRVRLFIYQRGLDHELRNLKK